MALERLLPSEGMAEPIRRRDLLAAAEERPPFHCHVLQLAPGASTAAHDHHDSEMWIIIAGQGTLWTDGAHRAIRQGDVIRLAPLVSHALHNTSPINPLVFLTMWWEDMSALAQAHQRRMEQDAQLDRSPRIVLPAFPTPNGDLHVGHLAGPYIAADVYRRAMRLRAIPVRTLLGSLGHMNHIAAAAARRGTTFYEAAEHFTAEICKTLASFDIAYDVFVRPTPTEHYVKLTQDIFNCLLSKGIVVRRSGVVNFCERCTAYCSEALVSGRCPFCAGEASGNDCEGCGRYHDDAQLAEPRCKRCGSPAARRALERFYLRLETLRERLNAFHARVAMDPGLRVFVASVMSEPLPDVAATHVAPDGVPVPVPTFENQRVYSCFEHAGRYLTAIHEAAAAAGEDGDWRRFLSASDARLVVFFGWDNAYMRAMLFPALLLAYVDTLSLPSALVMNRFYLLENAKFSTGRNHAVWGRELAARAPADAIRFYVSLTRPEAAEANFSLDDFERVMQAELGQQWEGWLREVQDRLEESFDGVAPEAGPWSFEAKRFYEDIRRLVADVFLAYDERAFSPQRACRAMCYFVASARRFGEAGRALVNWQPLARQAATHMALELMAVRAVAYLASPIMPRFTARMLAALGEDGQPAVRVVDDALRWIPAGRRVSTLGRRFFGHDQP